VGDDPGDCLLEFLLLARLPTLFDRNVDGLCDDELVGLGFVVRDEAGASFEVAIAVEEALVEATFLLMAWGEVVVIPLVVPLDSPHVPESSCCGAAGSCVQDEIGGLGLADCSFFICSF
jgi:hypothetical protein